MHENFTTYKIDNKHVLAYSSMTVLLTTNSSPINACLHLLPLANISYHKTMRNNFQFWCCSFSAQYELNF